MWRSAGRGYLPIFYVFTSHVLNIITVQIHLQFTVTVCEADSTTYTESDSTVCHEESDSDNDSLSSGPMFMEDTYDSGDDDVLPHIEVAKVEGPCPVAHGITAAAATMPDPDLDPDACPMHSDCDKCKCTEDDKDKKVFFFLCILFFFLIPNKKIYSNKFLLCSKNSFSFFYFVQCMQSKR